MFTNKFDAAKDKIIISASNKAISYLLGKYGSAHFVGEPKIGLTSTIDPNSSDLLFNGSVTCFATSDGLLNQVGVNLTVNDNDISVESEENIQANIENSLNSMAESNDVVVAASLDGFNLKDIGDGYLAVGHKDIANIVELGVVSRNEYETSLNKSALLQTIVKDAFTRIASELPTKYSFTGEFKEPTIEKKADDDKYCDECEKPLQFGGICEQCKRDLENDAMSSQKEVQPKKSWLTADLDTEEYVESDKTISIEAGMPLGKSTDHLAQAKQLEEQKEVIAQEKIKTEAVNSLVAMLHSFGYGSTKVAEVSYARNQIDVMVTVDDAGTVKAVNIPVVIKEAKVILPKKALVSELIHKGVDINARLSEKFGKQVLDRIAAEELRVQYEQDEVNKIIAERPTAMIKEASGSDNMQTLGDTETLELQKHLIPGHEDLKKGDKVSDGFSQWEIVDTEGHQNDKNEGSSSIWKLRKCAPAKSDDKEPATKLSI